MVAARPSGDSPAASGALSPSPMAGRVVKRPRGASAAAVASRAARAAVAGGAAAPLPTMASLGAAVTPSPSPALTRGGKPTCPPAFVKLRRNQYVGGAESALPPHDPPSCECVPPRAGGEGCGEDCLNRLTQTECCASSCPCGEECTNRVMQRGKRPKTKLSYMGCKGWGLQLMEPAKQGDFIVEYIGEVCTTAEMASRIAKYERDTQSHTFVMDVGADLAIDATQKGGTARFINHSCEPNCATAKWQVGKHIRVGIFAARDIMPGEELTYHYNLDWNGGKRVKCVCGAPSCHGFLGGHGQGFKEAMSEEKGFAWWIAPNGMRYPMDDLDTYDSTSEERAQFQAVRQQHAGAGEEVTSRGW